MMGEIFLHDGRRSPTEPKRLRSGDLAERCGRDLTPFLARLLDRLVRWDNATDPNLSYDTFHDSRHLRV